MRVKTGILLLLSLKVRKEKLSYVIIFVSFMIRIINDTKEGVTKM